MATYNDGPPILPHMPDFSAPSPTSSGIPSAADMKSHLQSLLDGKEKQLQQAATFGTRVLAQRVELEQRIRQLQELEADRSDDEEYDAEGRERYRELQDTIRAWDNENAQLSTAFLGSTKQRALNGKPSLVFAELPREEPERPKAAGGTSSAAQNRRAKNAAHRADDVEFAFEIGSGLLTEVRRLQSLLAERDKIIQDINNEKDDLEKSIESLRTALREQEQSSDKYKEENWNLEVTLQELRTQLSDSQSSTQRLEAEHKRLTKSLASSRDTSEQHKNESERLKVAFEELKTKHETDIAQARKQAAALQRDKSDLQSSLDKMKGEVARAGRRGPRLFGSPLTPDMHGVSRDMLTPAVDDPDDVFMSHTGGMSTRRNKGDISGMFDQGQDMFGGLDSPPDTSPGRPTFLTSTHPSNEIEALQQRLAHAQRQIGTLKGTLQREKEMKMDYRRRLEAASPGIRIVDEDGDLEEGEGEGDEDAYEDVEDAVGLVPAARQQTRRPISYRMQRGRGRGRGGRSGLTLVQRLGMAAHSPSSDYNDDREPFESGSPPPPVPALPIDFQAGSQDGNIFNEDEIADVDGEFDRRSPSPSPNPLEAPSNRASVDGMDPVFANVLRRQNSLTLYNASPLRPSIMPRGPAGRRRGQAYQQGRRPSSVIGQPEALAAELGLGSPGAMSINGGVGETILEDEMFSGGVKEEKVYGEMSCQTEILAEDVVVKGEIEEKEVKEVTPEIVITPGSPELVEMGVQADPVPEEKKEEVVEPAIVPVPEPTVVKVETSEMAMQTEEEAVAVIERSEMGVQHEPPVVEHVDAGMATDLVVGPSMAQAEVQTAEVETVEGEAQTMPMLVMPFVSKVDMDTQTVAEVAVFVPKAKGALAEMEVQTDMDLGGEEDEVEMDPRRATLTQLDVSRDSFGSAADTTITRPAGRFLAEPAGGAHREEDEDDDAGEETETGLDTDTDDYHDARMSVGMSTPSFSREDFHSVMTMSDNDFSESDDEESIRASRLSSRQGPASPSSIAREKGRPSSYYPPGMEEEKVERTMVTVATSMTPEVPEVEVEYDSKSVNAVQMEVEVPKPEVKEMSIQTDEWVPPAPPSPFITPSPAPVPFFVAPGTVVNGGTAQPRQQPQLQVVNTPGMTNATAVAAGAISALAASVAMPVPVPAAGANTPGGGPSNVFRESSATFGRPRTSTSDRRQSIESMISNYMDEPARSRVPSNQLGGVVDKTRPPMMVLPPPPRAPPPPSMPTPASANNMPPPSFIPERRLRTSLSATDGGGPPPRPSSPPPAELIQRATTPTFGSALSVPGRQGSLALRSQPGSQARLHQPSLTGSFRSAVNGASASSSVLHPSHPSSLNASLLAVKDSERRERAASERSVASPRSSISSDHNPFAGTVRSKALQNAPETPNRLADTSMRTNGTGNSSTDPTIIHAITQTMIGEFLYKYTRRKIGKGHGESRHRRFFWVHPYTKTLYWSSADPGSSNVSESSAKSAFIEGVRSVLDPNPMPPGLYQYSVVVSTPQREMKITAPTKERHDIWLNALKYLLSRPNPGDVTSPSRTAVPESPVTDSETRNFVTSSPRSQRSGRSALPKGDQWNTTPRGQRSRSQLSFRGSVGKRSGTPALEYLKWNGPESPYSPSKSFEHIHRGRDEEEEDDDEGLDFELHGDSREDAGFEGLENVRACCDGRHTVGHSGRIHHHHYHHPGEQNGVHQHQPLPSQPLQHPQHLEVQQPENPRPASPAWSFRSRAGSTHSGEGGGGGGVGGIFSWGRGEDGRLRFGSRRITKTVPSHDQ